MVEYKLWIDSFDYNNMKYFEELGQWLTKCFLYIEKPPKLKLNPLPEHLQYAYLGELSTYPIIISSRLSGVKEKKLLKVLRQYKVAIELVLADINGINLFIYIHHISLEKDNKSMVEQNKKDLTW